MSRYSQMRLILDAIRCGQQPPQDEVFDRRELGFGYPLYMRMRFGFL